MRTADIEKTRSANATRTAYVRRRWAISTRSLASIGKPNSESRNVILRVKEKGREKRKREAFQGSSWPLLRFLRRVAAANHLAAAGAAAAVFFENGFFQIDMSHIGDGHEPSQHVGEFRGQFLRRPIP